MSRKKNLKRHLKSCKEYKEYIINQSIQIEIDKLKNELKKKDKIIKNKDKKLQNKKNI